MNSGRTKRKYFLTFRTPDPILSSDRRLYESEFAQFGLAGLWLEYSEGTGTAYFSSMENANEAYRSLNTRNNMNMTLDPPAERRYNQYNKRNDYESDDIETSEDFMYDVYGNEIPVLYSSEEKVYVSLEDVEGAGYKLFKKPLSLQQPNEQWNIKLRTFLLNQATIFVYMNQVQFNSKQIFSTINRILSDVNANNSSSLSINSAGSAQENEGGRMMKPRAKTESIQLNISQKVRFLNCNNDNIYYIRLVNAEDKYYKICGEVNLIANNSQPINPTPHKINAVKHNGLWFRGMVMKTSPQLEVFLIDEGKVASGKLEVRSIPEELYKIPGQAIRVKLTTGCTAEEDQIADMTATVEYPDGTYLIKPSQSVSGLASDNDGSVKSFKGGQNKPKMSGLLKKFKDEEWKAEEPKSPQTQNNCNNKNFRASPQNNNFNDEKPKRNNFGSKPALPETSIKVEKKSSSSIQNDFHEERPSRTGNQNFQESPQNNNFGNAKQNNFGSKPALPETSSKAEARETKSPLHNQNNVVYEERPARKQNNADVNSKPKQVIETVIHTPPPMTSMMRSKAAMNQLQPAVKSTRKCVSDSLKDSQGFMEFVQMDDSKGSECFVGFIFPGNKLNELDVLESLADHVKDNPNFVPSVGDTVVVDYLQEGETETSSVRAVLLEKTGGEYKVALIDYGKIITAPKVSELPEKFRDIPEFAASCRTEEKYIDKIKEEVRFNFHSVQNGEMIIMEGTDSFNVSCEKWNPLLKVEQKTVDQILVSSLRPANPIKPNEMVKVINVEDSVLAIRTRESHRTLLAVMENLKEVKVKPLQNPPVVNQIVLYEENNDETNKAQLFRAQVKSITNSTISILKLDYGMTVTTTSGNLYYIDDFHNYEHTLQFKKLAGFEEAGFENAAVMDYMRILLKKENFTVASVTNTEIELLFSNKTNLADKLKSLLKPPFKRMEDIPNHINLPIGKSERVMLLHIQDVNCCDVTVTVCDPVIQNEFQNISDRLETECVKSLASLNVGQVCAGRYDDAWYRACIQEINEKDNKYKVYFFDFGNDEIVGIDDIRELPDDFINFSPMAVKCHIKNIYEKYQGNIPTEYGERLRNAVSSIYQIDILSKTGDKYNITIPELE